MEKEKAKELLMDFLVRKMGNKDFMAEALVNDYLNNDDKIANFISSKPLLADSLPTEQYPDNEADGIVFCGKCGAKK